MSDSDSTKECLPVRIEVFDCNDDGKVTYHEMVVALMLDEEDPSSLQAFEKWDENGQ
jgi:ferredoxin